MTINKLFSKITLKSDILHILILAIAFAFVYSTIFDSKIDTNGDNAGYYILAKSLATGQGYTNIHRPEYQAANHLPPGYPAIISTVFLTIGSDINTIKIVNGVLFFLSLLTLFSLFKILSGNRNLSFVITILTLLNPYLLRFSTLIMSEIPFLLFSSLTLLVFIKLDKQKTAYKNKNFYLFIVLLASSFYIRTAGIALVSGVVLALLLEKNYKLIFASISGFLILILPWQIRGYLLGGNSYINQLFQKNPYRPEMGRMDITDWFERFFLNLKRYIVHEIPNGTFPRNIIDYQSEIQAVDWIIGLALVLIMIFGILKIKKHKVLMIGYLLGSFGILLLWPEVWYGVRFLLPLIPFLILFAGIAMIKILENLKWSNKRITNISPYIFLLIIGFIIYPQLRITKIMADLPYPMNYNNYLFIAKWAKTNTPEDAIICCRKDQLFYLFSNRKTMRYKNTLDKEELIKNLNTKKVSHVVLDQLGFLSTPRYLYPAIQRHQEKFVTINHQKNPDTYLFEFKNQMGYTGAWKNDMKNGNGTFVYDNGESFSGIWKNNKRNGKGTYFLLNGDSIQGIWRDDSLIQEIK